METKYRTCEAVGVEASAEIQAAARKVLEENKRLRQLLKQQGFSDADIDGFSPTSDTPPSASSSHFPDNLQYPAAPNSLDGLLSQRRQCRPDSSCNSDDAARRQSCVSSVQSQSQSQSQCQPRQQHTATPTILPAQPPRSHSAMRLSPNDRPQSTMSAPATTTTTHVPPQSQPDATRPSQFPIYDPQSHAAYMYPMPMETMGQWSLPVAHLPPQSDVSHPQSYMGNTVPTTEAYAQDPNSTSCYVAANAIRSYSSNAGPEVEQVLGCRDGSECHVNNSVVFDLMDRYSANSNQRLA